MRMNPSVLRSTAIMSFRARPLRNADRSRLRRAAVLLVALTAAGIGYHVAGTPPVYLESATVVFTLPRSDMSPHAYKRFVNPSIMSGEAMVQVLMSPQTRFQIRRAGGTASVSLALVNLYNEEYPDYGIPLATLSAVSPSTEATHHTFMIAARLLRGLYAYRQAEAGADARIRFSAQIIADTGPTRQQGSLKRVLAGLGLLALVAVGALWGLIDARLRRASSS
jgi:hypothetical protein